MGKFIRSLERLEHNKNKDGTVKRSSLKISQTKLDFNKGTKANAQDARAHKHPRLLTPENSPIVQNRSASDEKLRLQQQNKESASIHYPELSNLKLLNKQWTTVKKKKE